MTSSRSKERFNVASYIVDRHLVHRRDRIAVVCEERTTTYQELFALVTAFGGRLGEMGVVRGERLLLVLPDSLSRPSYFMISPLPPMWRSRRSRGDLPTHPRPPDPPWPLAGGAVPSPRGSF